MGVPFFLRVPFLVGFKGQPTPNAHRGHFWGGCPKGIPTGGARFPKAPQGPEKRALLWGWFRREAKGNNEGHVWGGVSKRLTRPNRLCKELSSGLLVEKGWKLIITGLILIEAALQ